MADYSQIRSLFLRYMDGNLTAEESAQLSEAAETYSTTEWEEILEPLSQFTTPDQSFNIADWENEIQYILSQAGHEGHKGFTKNTKVIPLYRRKAFRWIAAAAIVGLLATGAVMLYVGVPANDRHQPTAVTHDVPAPSNTRAVITLADGTKVYLDSVSNGTIAQENNVNVVKGDGGEIRYSLSANSQKLTAKSPSYNTLFNPRGSKVISLTLSDGTKVWLNSESSLRYPAAFTTNTREVEITGEAYFEVKHNTKQPFKVHLPNGSIVEDIGTAFNINAYLDEAAIKTTLIEGSVKLSPAGEPVPPQREGEHKRPGVDNSVILKPGQQAVLTHDSRFTIDHPDVDEVLAWKNGYFQFNNASLQDVLKQLTRWYDVDIVYESQPGPRQFVGEMERTLSLQQVLKILEKNNVHFRIEGKKIIVMK